MLFGTPSHDTTLVSAFPSPFKRPIVPILNLGGFPSPYRVSLSDHLRPDRIPALDAIDLSVIEKIVFSRSARHPFF